MEYKCGNAADLKPLVRKLNEQLGLPGWRRVCAEQGIPWQIVHEPSSYLPYADICALYERAARLCGDPSFGIHCGEDWTARDLGAFGDYACSAPTLRQCLQRLILGVSRYESGTKGALVEHGDLIMFSYGNEYGHPIGRNHYADANLGLILDIFRSFTGPDWRPVRVETDNRKTPDIHMLEDFLESPVEGQKPALSLIFPAADLDTPNPKTACAREALTLRDIDFLENEKPPISTTEVVTAVVHLRLLGGLTDIAGAAQHLHTGVRTLQRRLSVEGMSYRRILLEQRNARALHLLRETDFSVTDIAVALGYEYAGDFTRAFSRYYGFAPTAIHGRASSQSDLKGPLHVT